MTATVYLIGHMYLKADQADHFEDVFKQHAKASRAKAGCLFFYLIRDREDRTKYSTMEAWEDMGYFDQHVADEEHEIFQQQLQPVLAAPVDARFYELLQGMD